MCSAANHSIQLFIRFPYIRIAQLLPAIRIQYSVAGEGEERSRFARAVVRVLGERCAYVCRLETFARRDGCEYTEEHANDDEGMATILRGPGKEAFIECYFAGVFAYKARQLRTEPVSGATNRLGRRSVAETIERCTNRRHQFPRRHDVPESAQVLFDVCEKLLHRLPW